jgi:hypothetical protein
MKQLVTWKVGGVIRQMTHKQFYQVAARRDRALEKFIEINRLLDEIQAEGRTMRPLPPDDADIMMVVSDEPYPLEDMGDDWLFACVDEEVERLRRRLDVIKGDLGLNEWGPSATLPDLQSRIKYLASRPR